MDNTRFLQLGWVVAAAFIGATAVSGFQDNTSKVGVVDISRVVEQSEFGKANQATFAQMKKVREDLLEFVDTYRVLTNEQAVRIRDLSLKPNATKEEAAELERLKADVIASNKKWQELSTKPNMTAEERTLVEEYARRSQTMNDMAQRWFRDFTNDMQGWADRQKVSSVERARAAIQQTAKAQGYSVVFEVGVAPYGANDLTEASLAAMNAAK